MANPLFLFAGGGSGGHISPGLAIAERLREMDPAARAMFLCSQRAIDREMLEEAGVEYIALPAAPFSKKPIPAARFAGNFMRSRRIVRRLIAKENPKHLIALGGFVAAPAVAAAARRIPTTLINLDAPPGKANQLIARKCDVVLTAIEVEPSAFRSSLSAFRFPLSALQRTADSGKRKAVHVGMPIRRRSLATPLTPQECRAKLGLDPAKQTLLVTGASQGATSINHMMIELATTSDARLLKGNRQVLHLTGHGEEMLAAVKRAYEDAGVHAIALPFLHEMGLAWGAASGDGLAISRAGASSVAEAWANGVPTIFMPYPHHEDEHQKHNAKPMVAAGGAVIVKDMIDAKQNAKSIAPVLNRLNNDRLELEAMSTQLRASAPPDAAAAIVRSLLNQ